MKDLKNSLLKRREVQLVVSNASNPGFQNSLKMVVDEYKSKDELVVVKSVNSQFGKNEFLIDAFIYDSVSDKEKIEPKKKVKKKAGEGAK